jgi:hypothetical protein
MRRSNGLALASLVVIVATGAAAHADRGDPQRRIIAADQARARAAIPRRSDFRRWDGVAQVRPAPKGASPYCKADDQSDLIVTGEARSKIFSPVGAPYDTVWGFSRVYSTEAQLKTAWRRVTSPAYLACTEAGVRRGLRNAGLQFRSFHQVPFPPLAPETVAYRLRYAEGKDDVLPTTVDYVLLGRSRAAVQLVFDGVFHKDGDTDLARIIARRLAKSMGKD